MDTLVGFPPFFLSCGGGNSVQKRDFGFSSTEKRFLVYQASSDLDPFLFLLEPKPPSPLLFQEEMEAVVVALLPLLLVANQIAFGSTSLSTFPAVVWSPHLYEYGFFYSFASGLHREKQEEVPLSSGSSNNGMNEAVNYRPISPKDLAKSVLSEGGWSNLMCSGENSQQPVDIALVFVGRELQSSDLSSNEHVDPALLDLLKFFTALKQVSFTRSNFSIAFPYVVASEVEETIENSLLSGFTESCGHRLGVRDIALLGSCSVEGEDFKKLADLHSVHDYLVSRMENKSKGQVDLILYCHGGTHSLKKLDQIPSEGKIFSGLISSVEQSGAKYTVLYTSDPYRSIRYSYQALGRFLAESASGNGSVNSTICDEICQIKSSLLEGVLVGIVLLIILISGLCCMMGIDTPSRFETPQDS